MDMTHHTLVISHSCSRRNIHVNNKHVKHFWMYRSLYVNNPDMGYRVGNYLLNNECCIPVIRSEVRYKFIFNICARLFTATLPVKVYKHYLIRSFYHHRFVHHSFQKILFFSCPLGGQDISIRGISCAVQSYPRLSGRTHSWQAIMWAYADPIHWRIYMALEVMNWHHKMGRLVVHVEYRIRIIALNYSWSDVRMCVMLKATCVQT